MEILSKFSERLDQSEHYEDVEPIVVQGRAEPLTSILRRMTRDDVIELQRHAVYENAGAGSLDEALQNVNTFDFGEKTENEQKVLDIVEELSTRRVNEAPHKAKMNDNVVGNSETENKLDGVSQQVKDNADTTALE